MSELRIALIAEGRTDEVLIQAALSAILPMPFVLTLLQPEPTRPEFGGGWGGVLKWCHASVQRAQGVLEEDPTLQGYDLFILHLDADVADKSYADCGAEITALAQHQHWSPLPCPAACPPAAAAAQNLQQALLSWLQQPQLGQRSLLCIPSRAVESWLAAAVLPADSTLLDGLECCAGMEGQLARLPKKQRIKKQRRDYLLHAQTLTQNWARVRQLCSQAAAFERAVQAALPV